MCVCVCFVFFSPPFVTPGSFHPHHPSFAPIEARRKRSHTYQACQTKTCCSSTTTASSHRGQTSERPSLPWNRNWCNPASQCKVDGTDHWRHSYFNFLFWIFVVVINKGRTRQSYFQKSKNQREKR